jgi:hypothetical protein
MKKLLDTVIPKKTNKKKLIVETNHILEKISKEGLDVVIKDDETDKQKPQ